MSEPYSEYKLDAEVEDFDFKTKVRPGRVKLGKSAPNFTRRNENVEIFDQGYIGSCVGASGKVLLEDFHNGDKSFSTQFIYQNAKALDQWAGEDYSGTSITGACKGLVKFGAAEQNTFPYVLAEKIPVTKEAYDSGRQHRAKDWWRISIDDVDLIKEVLKTQRLWTAYHVHSEFYTARSDGFIKNEDNYLKSKKRGGHAVCMVGWRTIKGKLFWEFQNSWGSRFGDDGYFFVSHDLYKKISKGVYKVDYKKGRKIKGDPKKPSLFARLFASFSNLIKKIFRLK